MGTKEDVDALLADATLRDPVLDTLIAQAVALGRMGRERKKA